MLLSDAMSRCPLRNFDEIKLDMRVYYIAFNKTWIANLKEATWEDPILSTVYQLTQQGWPHQGRHTLQMASVYWDFKDELFRDEDLLLKGPCIVISSCLHEENMERLHHGHLSRSNGMLINICIGLDWMQTSWTTQEHAKNVSREHIHYKPTMCHSSPRNA